MGFKIFFYYKVVSKNINGKKCSYIFGRNFIKNIFKILMKI